MTSNAPPNEPENTSFTLNSPPPIHPSHPNVGMVTQLQERTLSQSSNLFSPSAQFDLLLSATDECDNNDLQTLIQEPLTNRRAVH